MTKEQAKKVIDTATSAVTNLAALRDELTASVNTKTARIAELEAELAASTDAAEQARLRALVQELQTVNTELSEYKSTVDADLEELKEALSDSGNPVPEE